MIQKIKLTNLRCFDDVTFEFGAGDNLIVGSNGSGKTTIVEAIGLFTFGRFVSIPQDSLAVRAGENLSRVEISIQNKDRKMSAEVAFGLNEKAFKLMGNKVPISEIVGFVRAVYFNPETIDLISGAPQIRRREIDSAIAQKDHLFVPTLLHYKSVLKQRNVLLRRIGAGQAKKSEMTFWDHELKKYGREILTRRESFISDINQNLRATHEKLLEKKSALALAYQPSCDYERFDEVLAAGFEADLGAGLTLCGPHRDDMIFEQSRSEVRKTNFVKSSSTETRHESQANMRDGASRGEQRVAAVAFKHEVKKYLTSDEEPILIFDDVFSELDEKSRAGVAKIIENGQLIISATDEKIIPEILRQRANVLKL